MLMVSGPGEGAGGGAAGGAFVGGASGDGEVWVSAMAWWDGHVGPCECCSYLAPVAICTGFLTSMSPPLFSTLPRRYSGRGFVSRRAEIHDVCPYLNLAINFRSQCRGSSAELAPCRSSPVTLLQLQERLRTCTVSTVSESPFLSTTKLRMHIKEHPVPLRLPVFAQRYSPPPPPGY